MMKKTAILILLSFILAGSSIFYAQVPNAPKPAPAKGEGIARIREDRTEKREELSKKLMQRKIELRKEEHNQTKEHRNAEARERSNNPK